MLLIQIKGIDHISNCSLSFIRCSAGSRHKTTQRSPPGRKKQPFQAVHFFETMSSYLLTNSYFSPLFYTNSVEMAGFEPATFALQRRCSPTELHPQDLPG